MAITPLINMDQRSPGPCSRRYRPLVAAAISFGLASCAPEQPTPEPPTTPAEDTSPSRATAPTSTLRLPVQAAKPTEHVQSTSAEPDSEKQFPKEILGVWKQNNTGTRWLRFRQNGTGTMFIEPNWVAKMVIGDSLTMHIKWHIKDDGRAVMTSVSGTPEGAYQVVTDLYGGKRVRSIITLNDNRLVFRDEEDDSLSKWKRPDRSEKLPEPIAKIGQTKNSDKNG